jgi:acetyl esterase/lipase
MGSRPDFLILAYPVVALEGPHAHKGSGEGLLGPEPDPTLASTLSSDRLVTPRTPPTFLFHTDEDEGVPVENSLAFYEALRRARVPAELHVFTKGPHGIGLAPHDPAASAWPALCAAWMRAMGFLSPR